MTFAYDFERDRARTHSLLAEREAIPRPGERAQIERLVVQHAQRQSLLSVSGPPA